MPHRHVISLGQFRPSALHELIIASELQEWLRSKGIVAARLMSSKGRLPIQVRQPEDHIKLSTTDKIIVQWHRDGLGARALERDPVPSTGWIILWSNRTPTELCDSDGAIIPCLPYDVVLVDNRVIWHKCPPPENGRWFVRLLDPILPEQLC